MSVSFSIKEWKSHLSLRQEGIHLPFHSHLHLHLHLLCEIANQGYFDRPLQKKRPIFMLLATQIRWQTMPNHRDSYHIRRQQHNDTHVMATAGTPPTSVLYRPRSSRLEQQMYTPCHILLLARVDRDRSLAESQHCRTGRVQSARLASQEQRTHPTISCAASYRTASQPDCRRNPCRSSSDRSVYSMVSCYRLSRQSPLRSQCVPCGMESERRLENEFAAGDQCKSFTDPG